jgi:predicted Zn-dependent protease
MTIAGYLTRLRETRTPPVRCIMLATALFGLSGCETNPISGRSTLAIVSEESAQASSSKAYAQKVETASRQGKLSTDAALNARVKHITDDLVAQAKLMHPPSKDWKWEVRVLDEPTINAWCMPGGKMAIYTGIIQKLSLNDDEVAQIMGHEIAHALLGHGRERMSRAFATSAGLTLGSIVVGADLTGFSPLVDIALNLPNSREGESEADRYGIELAARAGFNPEAAVTLWKKMAATSKGGPPAFLSTHPSSDERIQALGALVPQMMPIYQKAHGGNQRTAVPTGSSTQKGQRKLTR